MLKNILTGFVLVLVFLSIVMAKLLLGYQLSIFARPIPFVNYNIRF